MFLADSLDWTYLLNLAQRHGMLGLLARWLTSQSQIQVPSSFRDSLNDHCRSHAALALHLTAELFRILDAFRSRSLDVLLTKGPALSLRCYGDPALRGYGDLDLIVRHEDIRRATGVMLELGYQSKIPLSAIDDGKTPGEYNFTKSGTAVLIEFHTERTFRYHPRPIPIEQLFARSTSIILDARPVPVLSLEDELILICVHGAKHFWERLLWIADVAALSQCSQLDWDRVNSAAAEVQAQRILHLGLQLAASILSAPIPASLKSEMLADQISSRVAASILSRFPIPDAKPLTLFQRAAFRVHMRRSLLDGLAYLFRLSFTPTEEDWSAASEPSRSPIMEALLRPARLAGKHRTHKA